MAFDGAAELPGDTPADLARDATTDPRPEALAEVGTTEVHADLPTDAVVDDLPPDVAAEATPDAWQPDVDKAEDLGAETAAELVAEETSADAMPEKATAVVGPDGGTFPLPKGGELIVPPGALTEEVVLSVETTAPLAVNGFVPAGPFYRFEPEGLLFLVPVSVALPFEATADPAALVVLWSGTGNVVEVFPPALEADTGIATLLVDHFSVGGPALPGTCTSVWDCSWSGGKQCIGTAVAWYECNEFGSCVLVDSADCSPYGKVCDGGACVEPCLANEDCEAFGNDACTPEADAVFGSRCLSGKCQVGLVELCAEKSQVCAAGVCIGGPCATTADCPEGGTGVVCEGDLEVEYFCEAGVCVPVLNGFLDCGALGWPCVPGQGCMEPCGQVPDCNPQVFPPGPWCLNDQVRGAACLDGLCAIGVFENCAANGLLCTEAVDPFDDKVLQAWCAPACGSDGEECPGGGVEVVCDGDFAVEYFCDAGVCAPVLNGFLDCGALGWPCVPGQGCMEPCGQVSDCNPQVFPPGPWCLKDQVRGAACLDGLCAIGVLEDCAANGLLCTEAVDPFDDKVLQAWCAPACGSDADCPGGGVEVVCDGDFAVEYFCDAGVCAPVLNGFLDCGALGLQCLLGSCVPACGTDGDCVAFGVPVCEGTTAVRWVCKQGQCLESKTDCSEAEKVCAAGACAACEADAQCPGGGQPACSAEASAVRAVLCLAGACEETTLWDCAAEGLTCDGAACTPCEQDADCPGHGKLTCDGPKLGVYAQGCAAGNCVAALVQDCVANGEVCLAGACVPKCDEASACPGQGAAMCEGDKLVQFACLESSCQAAVLADCMADGYACLAGACMMPCTHDADCQDPGTPFCEEGSVVWHECDENAGGCVQKVKDCSLDGSVCKAGQCTACSTSADCPGGGAPFCEEGSSILHGEACDPATDKCVAMTKDCAAMGQGCAKGACEPKGCKTLQDCFNAGKPYCEGEVSLAYECHGGTGKCLGKTLAYCDLNGMVCDETSGECKPAECNQDEDCPGFEAPSCKPLAPILLHASCDPETKKCQIVETNCAASDQLCFAGACVPSQCTTKTDCPAKGESFCDGNTTLFFVCSEGKCQRKGLYDCATKGELCFPELGGCEPTCNTDKDCSHLGTWWCGGGKAIRMACEAPGGRCVAAETIDCTAGKMACEGGKCVPGCATNADCKNGGNPYCDGDKLVYGKCLTDTYSCLQKTIKACGSYGQICAPAEAACKAPCESDQECYAIMGGPPLPGKACNLETHQSWSCSKMNGCVVKSKDCAAKGMVCEPLDVEDVHGKCVPACSAAGCPKGYSCAAGPIGDGLEGQHCNSPCSGLPLVDSPYLMFATVDTAKCSCGGSWTASVGPLTPGNYKIGIVSKDYKNEGGYVNCECPDNWCGAKYNKSPALAASLPDWGVGLVQVYETSIFRLWFAQSKCTYVGTIDYCILAEIPPAAPVNSVEDKPDANPLDGACSTGDFILRNGIQEPECTLRGALETELATPSGEAIWFNIPGVDGLPVIKVTSPLPVVAVPLLLVGTSQPGAGRVAISGAGGPMGMDGLVVSSNGCYLAGITLQGFSGHGLRLLGDVSISLADVKILGNGGWGIFSDGNLELEAGDPQNPPLVGLNGVKLKGSGGILSLGKAKVTGVVVEKNHGPGLLAKRRIELAGVSVVGNQGPGVRSVLDGVVFDKWMGAGNVVSGNLGVGVQAHETQESAFGILCQAPLEVKDNASWGVKSLGAARLGGIGLSQAKDISHNGHGAVCWDAWLDGDMYGYQAMSECLGGGLVTTRELAAWNVSALENKGPGFLCWDDADLANVDIRKNVGPGIRVMSGGLSFSTLSDDFVNRVSENLGVGLQAGGGGEAAGVGVFGRLEVNENASWGLVVKGSAGLGGAVGMAYPKEVSLNGHGDECWEWLLESEQNPDDYEYEEMSECLGGGLLATDQVKASSVQLIGNNGPGLLSLHQAELIDVVIADNAGQGVHAMGGPVILSTNGAMANVVSNNLGIGVQSASGEDVLENPFGVKVIGPLEVSGNASWGILTKGPALLGGQSAESYPRIIKDNGHGTTCWDWIIEGTKAEYYDYGKMEDCRGGGVVTFKNLVGWDVEATGNNGPGIMAETGVNLLHVRSNENLGEGIQAGSEIQIGSLKEGMVSQGNGDLGRGLYCLDGSVSADWGIEVTGNAGRGIEANGDVSVGLLGGTPAPTQSLVSDNGGGEECWEWDLDEPTVDYIPYACEGGGILSEYGSVNVGNAQVNENKGIGIKADKDITVNKGQVCKNAPTDMETKGTVTQSDTTPCP
ncbi:MAG: hypothetical protein FJ109_07880 [Deltaproteobacteria bacterium]|nr:hypothetical protein [Deltaproteobacteria bacterium]